MHRAEGMHFNRICREAVYTGTPQRSREETTLQPGFCPSCDQSLCGWAGFNPSPKSSRSSLDALEGLKSPSGRDRFCAKSSLLWPSSHLGGICRYLEGRVKKKKKVKKIYWGYAWNSYEKSKTKRCWRREFPLMSNLRCRSRPEVRGEVSDLGVSGQDFRSSPAFSFLVLK